MKELKTMMEVGKTLSSGGVVVSTPGLLQVPHMRNVGYVARRESVADLPFWGSSLSEHLQWGERVLFVSYSMPWLPSMKAEVSYNKPVVWVVGNSEDTKEAFERVGLNLEVELYRLKGAGMVLKSLNWEQEMIRFIGEFICPDFWVEFSLLKGGI